MFSLHSEIFLIFSCIVLLLNLCVFSKGAMKLIKEIICDFAIINQIFFLFPKATTPTWPPSTQKQMCSTRTWGDITPGSAWVETALSGLILCCLMGRDIISTLFKTKTWPTVQNVWQPATMSGVMTGNMRLLYG